MAAWPPVKQTFLRYRQIIQSHSRTGLAVDAGEISKRGSWPQ